MNQVQFGYCVPIFAWPGGLLFRTPNFATLDSQAALQTAQARLAEMEAKTKLADEVDKEKIMKKAKVLRDMTDRPKEAGDKADWKAKEKADKAARDFTKEKSRTDRSKHDDELEKRFDRMMREMEELGRELKRRRSEDKSSPDKPQGF